MIAAGTLPLTPIYALDASIVSCSWLLAAAILLDLFDISLPRGDSVGVAGALCAASIFVVGPVLTLLIFTASALLAHTYRRGLQSLRRLAAVELSRAMGIAAGALFLALYSDYAHSLVVGFLVPIIFLVVEMIAAQAVVAATKSRPFLRLLRGNLRSQAPVMAAQWSAASLLILTYGGMNSFGSGSSSYEGMGLYSLIPFVALLLLMRQSYALFLDIRETYRTTVEVLVEAAESQDSRRAGHSDRTAAMARTIAVRLGLNAAAVERVSYAALLHDLGELSKEPRMVGAAEPRQVSSADVVRDVEFFGAVEPILSVCDGGDAAAVDEPDLTAALIVALASDIDAAEYAEVAAAHSSSTLARVAPMVPSATKARVVAAALELGYRIPAVG